MKQFSLFTFLFLLLILGSSCSSPSMESDTRKIASHQCKMRQLMDKHSEPDVKVQEELEKMEKELDKMTEDFEKKWGDPEKDVAMQNKIIAIMKEEKAKCK